MKRLGRLLIIQIFMILYINGCDENISSIASDNNRINLTGTWKEVRLKRYDSLNVVIQDDNLDTLRNCKISFNGIYQQLHIDTTHNFYFLLYKSYYINNDSIYCSPDSLLSANGITSIWNNLDSTFTPYFPVKTYPFGSKLKYIDESNILETRKFPEQTLEIHLHRLSNVPADLSSELLSVGTNKLSKVSKSKINFENIYFNFE